MVNLSPFRLADIPDGIDDVGAAIHRIDEACALIGEWNEKFAALRRRQRPALRIAFLDWLKPPFAAGHWVPDLIELVGCESLLAKPGEPSFEITWDDVRAARPDIVIAACCGLSKARASQDRLPDDLDVQILDGYEHFSRPGPGLLQSAELLAAVVEKRLYQ